MFELGWLCLPKAFCVMKSFDNLIAKVYLLLLLLLCLVAYQLWFNSFCYFEKTQFKTWFQHKGIIIVCLELGVSISQGSNMLCYQLGLFLYIELIFKDLRKIVFFFPVVPGGYFQIPTKYKWEKTLASFSKNKIK
jgi:hypothetical protein